MSLLLLLLTNYGSNLLPERSDALLYEHVDPGFEGCKRSINLRLVAVEERLQVVGI